VPDIDQLHMLRHPNNVTAPGMGSGWGGVEGRSRLLLAFSRAGSTGGSSAVVGFEVMTSVVTVVSWSELLATDPEVRVRFPALPDFVRSSGFGTESTQPCQHN
jgi:hypothetical protein